MRIGVVGFGAIGRHHARNLASLPDVDFAGIADVNEASREQARALGYKTYSSVSEILSRGVDALIISVPTGLHYDTALDVIDANCAMLIEKPIAHTSDAGRRIIELCRQKNIPLMIGYVERYNPAIVAIRKFLSEGGIGEIYSIDARRVGVLPPRIRDANVLIDIAVHDIDLVAFILQSELKLRSALGGRAILNDRVDYAVLALEAGRTAVTITSNWITPVKIRNLFITGSNGLCYVDYITQSAKFAPGREFALSSTFENTIEQYSEGEFLDLPVEKNEPLNNELRTFINGLRTGDLPDPSVSLVSLEIAEEATLRIEESHLRHRELAGA